MSVLKHPISICILAMGTLIYTASVMDITLPSWATSYVNDLVCMPLVLSMGLAIMRIYHKNQNLYVPGWAITILCAYYTIHFEVLMPLVSSRYTSDIIDVVLYFSGGILFYGYQKKIY